MKTLLIDNYDSFVYNIEQMLGEIGVDITVAKNDELKGINASDYGRIVISPGPGNPSIPGDSGDLSSFLKADLKAKVLGICFGHQIIAYNKGSGIEIMKRQFHGEIDTIVHGESPLYNGIPPEFKSIRYHSLTVSPSPDIIIDCYSRSDGSIMGFHTPDFKRFGVQFHPESFYSEYGKKLFENFLEA